MADGQLRHALLGANRGTVLITALVMLCLGLGVGISRSMRRMETREAAEKMVLPPVFSPDLASPLPPAQVLSSGLIGCPATEVAISEMHQGREGEASWVASCLGRVLACTSLTGTGPQAQRQVYCAERRVIVVQPRPGQNI